MAKPKTYVDADGVIQTGVFLRTPYNYDRDAVSDETALVCEEETMTQQSFKDECDINIIMERFGVTGELPENVRMPVSADFEEIFDFQSAQNLIIEAREAFMQMPAGVRARFENNPLTFVEFFSDDKNREEGERLGLIIPRPAPAQEPPPEAENTPKA